MKENQIDALVLLTSESLLYFISRNTYLVSLVLQLLVWLIMSLPWKRICVYGNILSLPLIVINLFYALFSYAYRYYSLYFAHCFDFESSLCIYFWKVQFRLFVKKYYILYSLL